ncbi:hypothetical protein A2U01_0064265, partial [Trifolium medium]|nr:hypothetical protein [Trifolium medium]
MARDHQPGGEDEARLERFMKHKPPTFTGGYNLEGAVNWLEEVEIIFEAMGCSEESKVTLVAYVLREEANHWWKNARQRLGAGGAVKAVGENMKHWEMFKIEFLIKYFPAD